MGRASQDVRGGERNEEKGEMGPEEKRRDGMVSEPPLADPISPISSTPRTPSPCSPVYELIIVSLQG